MGLDAMLNQVELWDPRPGPVTARPMSAAGSNSSAL